MLKQNNIDLNAMPEEDFDSPLGQPTGAAVIFGATGGVMEAAVRTAFGDKVYGRLTPHMVPGIIAEYK